MASGAIRVMPGAVSVSLMLILLLVIVGESGFERVEAAAPEVLPLAQPALGFGKRRGLEADEVGAAGALAGDQAGVLEHLHVLGGASEAHRQRLGKLANRPFAKGELCQHPAAGGIRQRGEDRVES